MKLPTSRRVSLKARLSLIFALLALLLTASLVFIIGQTATEKVKTGIGLSLAELAYQTTDKLDRGMFERYRDVSIMSELQVINDPAVSVNEKREFLNSLQRTYPDYAWIGIVDANGRIDVATQGMLEGASVAKRIWFTNALRGTFVGDVHEAVLLAKLLPSPDGEPKRFIDVAFPFSTPGGKLGGVLGVHLSWQWAKEVEQSVILPARAHSEADVLILSKDGTVLLGPKDIQGETLDLMSFKAASRGENDYVVEQWADGKKYLVGFNQSEGYRNYPGLGWTVLVRRDIDTAFAPVQELQLRILLWGLGFAMLFSLAGYILAKRISHPLFQIAASAQRIRAGDPDAKMPEDAPYSEATALAGSLNSLLESERQKEAALKELNESLEQRVVERTQALENAMETLQSSEARTRLIIDTAYDAFVAIDSEGRIVDWNPQAEKTFGWRKEEVLGEMMHQLIMPEQHRHAHEQGLKRFAASKQGSVLNQRLEFTAIRRNGEEFPVEFTVSAMKAGNTQLFGAFLHDITERKLTEQALVYIAQHDALTGLPNRLLFNDRLKTAIDRAERSKKPLALMFLDLDGFKNVNDTLGHTAGDLLLKEFAKRLSTSVRKSDTIARLAGDEFTVIVENLASIDNVADIAEKIVKAASTPFDLNGQIAHVSTSIGIALYDAGDDTADALIKRADTAMYHTKKHGRNSFHVYDATLDYAV